MSGGIPLNVIVKLSEFGLANFLLKNIVDQMGSIAPLGDEHSNLLRRQPSSSSIKNVSSLRNSPVVNCCGLCQSNKRIPPNQPTNQPTYCSCILLYSSSDKLGERLSVRSCSSGLSPQKLSVDFATMQCEAFQ